MDISIYISLTVRSQDQIGLHLRIYSSRPMSVGDGGCRLGTVKVPSPADTGCAAVILMFGRHAVSGRWTGRLRTLLATIIDNIR
jgi:hypothetical protein